MATSDHQRVQHEPAYVLHTTPYKETSLVVQMFSRHYGRIAVVAKGAKRPHSSLRGVLLSMQPLRVAWSGKGEIKTLTHAYWVGGQLAPRGESVLNGFYLNELLLKLLAREDKHEALFDAYGTALGALASGKERVEIVLRRFEFCLLRELGMGADWRSTLSGELVQEQHRYVCLPELGVRRARDDEPQEIPVIEGAALLAMGQGDFSALRTLQQGKQLIRYWLNHLLAGKTLNTRQVLMELQQL